MSNTLQTTTIPYGNNPSAGHYKNVDDTKIYYEIYGSGKPLVILHGGIVGSTYEMAELIDNFSKRYQVIAISTRGHGKSGIGTKPHTYEQKAKDVVAVLNEVTKDSVTVFGFSDGGYTGYCLASLFPARVKQMIILGAAETQPGDYKINLKVSDMMKIDHVYWEQQLKLMPEPDRLQEMFDKVSDATAKMQISKDFFSTIKCPVLVMAGNHDQFLTTQRVVNASKMIPNAELAIIPNATHAAFLENFPAVWATTASFLKIPVDTIQFKNKTTMNNTAEQILMHHLVAFGDNNLNEILKDYTEQSVIMTPQGPIKGLGEIREFFKVFFNVIPTGSSFSMKQKTINGNVAYIVWASKSNTAEIPFGTDTFVFEGDKIKYHTVADFRSEK
ncbi:alpha/beta fold hydrolase [Flavobacterium sp. KJJ]|uniref:alpha/beta fold hydrolase n=1 Tax=Flavobacterium sp. KJJ TaxID=1270193 RepID=UPI0018D00235|nr:alpha/beta fold hydrolase [Flavobacterium sp. KJJ]